MFIHPWDSGVDDAQGKVDVLTAQLADVQPEGRRGEVDVDSGPYARMLSGIRAVRLAVVDVEATFTYVDHKTVEHRERVNARLVERGRVLVAKAAAQQRRRLEEIGDWSRLPPSAGRG